MLKLGVIGSLRSVESVKPNGNWKPKKFTILQDSTNSMRNLHQEVYCKLHPLQTRQSQSSTVPPTDDKNS